MMPRIRWLGLALLACVAVFSPAVGFAEPVGSALVVGIDDYAGMPVLANCRQIAKDVAARLRQRGLQVDEEIDVPGATLRNAIDNLADRVAAAPSLPAVVYVCGIADAVDNRLFLLPANVDLGQPAHSQTQGIVLWAVLNALEGADGLLVADLDLHSGSQVRPAAQALDAALAGNKHLAVLAADDNDGSLGHTLSAALQPDGETLSQAADALRQVQKAYPIGSQLALHVPAADQPLPPSSPTPVVVAEVAKAALASLPVPEPPNPAPNADSDQHIRLIKATLAQHRSPSAQAGGTEDQQTTPAMAPTVIAARPQVPAEKLPAKAVAATRPDPRIRRVQLALVQRRLLNGPADGIEDARTAHAIRAWQMSLGDIGSGTLTPPEIVKLLNVW